MIDTTPHVSYNISLSAFTPHYRSTEASTLLAQNESRAKDDSHPEEENGDDEPIYYTHPCRCSSEFVITYQDLEDGIEVVGCGGCGEWVRVGYEVLDDETEVDEE
jgi:diphthamide biosynthesis protein 4